MATTRPTTIDPQTGTRRGGPLIKPNVPPESIEVSPDINWRDFRLRELRPELREPYPVTFPDLSGILHQRDEAAAAQYQQDTILSRPRGFVTRSLDDIKGYQPERLQFKTMEEIQARVARAKRQTHPRRMERPDDNDSLPPFFFEEICSSLFARVWEFANDTFGHKCFAGQLQDKDWTQHLIRNLPADFVRCVSVVARGDPARGAKPVTDEHGYELMFLSKNERVYLCTAVVAKLLEENCFDSLLFGATRQQRQTLALIDRSTENYSDGYYRKFNRRGVASSYLTHNLETQNFWGDVDRVTTEILVLLLPLINMLGAMDELTPQDLHERAPWPSLRVVHQKLHHIVAEAAWVCNANQTSRSVFWCEFPQPGQLWDQRQQHTTDTTWQASYAAAIAQDDQVPAYRDSEPVVAWRATRDTAYAQYVSGLQAGAPLPRALWSSQYWEPMNPKPRHPIRRTAKVQIAMWPFFERYFPRHQDTANCGGFNDGESINTVKLAEVVYYAGQDDNDSDLWEDYTLRQHLDAWESRNRGFLSSLYSSIVPRFSRSSSPNWPTSTQPVPSGVSQTPARATRDRPVTTDNSTVAQTAAIRNNQTTPAVNVTQPLLTPANTRSGSRRNSQAVNIQNNTPVVSSSGSSQAGQGFQIPSPVTPMPAAARRRNQQAANVQNIVPASPASSQGGSRRSSQASSVQNSRRASRRTNQAASVQGSAPGAPTATGSSQPGDGQSSRLWGWLFVLVGTAMALYLASTLHSDMQSATDSVSSKIGTAYESITEGITLPPSKAVVDESSITVGDTAEVTADSLTGEEQNDVSTEETQKSLSTKKEQKSVSSKKTEEAVSSKKTEEAVSSKKTEEVVSTKKTEKTVSTKKTEKVVPAKKSQDDASHAGSSKDQPSTLGSTTHPNDTVETKESFEDLMRLSETYVENVPDYTGETSAEAHTVLSQIIGQLGSLKLSIYDHELFELLRHFLNDESRLYPGVPAEHQPENVDLQKLHDFWVAYVAEKGDSLPATKGMMLLSHAAWRPPQTHTQLAEAVMRLRDVLDFWSRYKKTLGGGGGESDAPVRRPKTPTRPPPPVPPQLEEELEEARPESLLPPKTAGGEVGGDAADEAGQSTSSSDSKFRLGRGDWWFILGGKPKSSATDTDTTVKEEVRSEEQKAAAPVTVADEPSVTHKVEHVEVKYLKEEIVSAQVKDEKMAVTSSVSMEKALVEPGKLYPEDVATWLTTVVLGIEYHCKVKGDDATCYQTLTPEPEMVATEVSEATATGTVSAEEEL